MKRSLFAMLGLSLLLASCVSKQAAVQVENQRDSLAVVVSEKDSLLNLVFADINAITENLAQIKSREQLISVAGSAEGVRRPVEEIEDDIAAIDRLLQENKAKIASLQHAASQLRKANLRIEGLEKMIAGLTERLREQGAEVESLRRELEQRNVEVEELTEQVAVRNAQVEELIVEKSDVETQLNTVYYIVGAEKELRDAQIIDKQGFIGRTLTVNRNGNLDSFTRADLRLLEEIPIGRKRVSIVTSHPEDAYTLITDADKQVVKLVIEDPARFWESSKVLIVSYR